MTLPTSVPDSTRTAIRAAFRALIDYAGLFPPARLPMHEAAAEYAAARNGAAAWILGRFIVPASRARELLGAVDALGVATPIPASVIVDADLDPRRWFASAQAVLHDVAELRRDRRMRVEALEIPVPPLATKRETFDAPIGQLGALLDRAGLSDLPAYAELPRGDGWLELLEPAMAAAARARVGAKIRCGGVTAAAFPTPAEIAAFVAAANASSVAFKATAGLHHPVRHLDAASGFVMHGFLNVLAAAALAPELDAAALEGVVAEEDPGAFAFDEGGFAWRDRRVGVERLSAARAGAFVAYGSCSFAEPVEDLTSMRLLPPAS
ncbi:MAG TPA: hypothetical protein VMF61_05995 [Candidatus Acidoferrales bacterium]|nr:hypothetical protein [Candidatus Acidoferrales bacterium]